MNRPALLVLAVFVVVAPTVARAATLFGLDPASGSTLGAAVGAFFGTLVRDGRLRKHAQECPARNAVIVQEGTP